MRVPVYVGYGGAFDGQYETEFVDIPDDTPEADIDRVAVDTVHAEHIKNNQYKGKFVEFILVAEIGAFSDGNDTRPEALALERPLSEK